MLHLGYGGVNALFFYLEFWGAASTYIWFSIWLMVESPCPQERAHSNIVWSCIFVLPYNALHLDCVSLWAIYRLFSAQ